MTTYAVAAIKPWNLEEYSHRSRALPGKWHLITDPKDLTLDHLQKIQPRYVFFPHWSWKVPKEIHENFECVLFHMTDVPFGRGGSPLQNLIMAGAQDTKISAIHMGEGLDDGPVYLKHPLSLSGRAEEIYRRCAKIVFDMIEIIVEQEPVPVPQSGEPHIFKRRTPPMSVLPERADISRLYDHIRMLDAETYPPAFLDYGAYRMTFSHAHLEDGAIKARVRITQAKTDD